MNHEKQKLQKYTKQLYTKTGQLNLYICFCYKKDEPDHFRLKEEIGQIKQLISNIEIQINCL